MTSSARRVYQSFLFPVVAIKIQALAALAHHSPEDVVANLTAQIEQQSDNTTRDNTTLLVRRADEWRILRQLSNAAADYRLALEYDHKNRLAYHGLARTQIDQNRFDAAIETAQQGIVLVSDDDLQAPFHALIAFACSEKKEYRTALTAWKKAIACQKPEVDWLLGHARTLKNLGHETEARDALALAMRRNASVVLKRAWIDQLIVCGDFKIADEQILAGIDRSRWKSSWLLQRAKLHIARDKTQLARQDAQEALQEINARLVPTIKNPLLEQQKRRAEGLLHQIELYETSTNQSATSNI